MFFQPMMIQALLQKRNLHRILEKEIRYVKYFNDLKRIESFCDNSVKIIEGRHLPGFKVRLCIVVCHTLLRSGNKRILA